MPSNKTRHEFTVLIEGVQLPTETVERINAALQKVALIEVASLDLRGDELVCRPIMAAMISAGNGGSTGGVQIRIEKHS